MKWSARSEGPKGRGILWTWPTSPLRVLADVSRVGSDWRIQKLDTSLAPLGLRLGWQWTTNYSEVSIGLTNTNPLRRIFYFKRLSQFKKNTGRHWPRSKNCSDTQREDEIIFFHFQLTDNIVLLWFFDVNFQFTIVNKNLHSQRQCAKYWIIITDYLRHNYCVNMR